VIGSEGKVEADIVANNVFIAGELIGTVYARTQVEITEKGKVYGDITTRNLMVDQGVMFEGKCHMISEEEGEESSDPLAASIPLATASSDAA
jgi:cytoskeletal protein CcmA (bactofilin family)